MGNKKPQVDIKVEDIPLSTPQVNTSFQTLSTDLIDDPERPMRSEITDLSVEDLVLSIKQVGVIEPLVVKPVNGRFEIIAGHRRLYASRLAKLLEVPCYVRKVGAEESEMLKIHENLYRMDIKPADEAQHFSYLIDKHGMTPQKVAGLISKSVNYVMDRLQILNYPDFLLDALNSGKINLSVAREFFKFDDLGQMKQAVWYAARGGMTGELAKKWVADYYAQKERPVIQTETHYDPQNGSQEVEHSVNCVYCLKPVKLIEAEVVYMHHNCLVESQHPDTSDK
jgi:ParB family chromosome partitioning protein